MKTGLDLLPGKFCSGLRILRDQGFAEFARELTKKLYLDYKAYWYERNLLFPPTDQFPSTLQFEVVNDQFDETISWMAALRIPGLANPREIENMRNEGHWIYTLMSDSLIAGYVKVGRGKVFIADLDKEIWFPQNSAFVMDSFIHQNFRGKRLFHLLISHVIKDLFEKDYRCLYCHIRIDNIRSINAYEKNGFIRIGTVCYRKILWKRTLESQPKSIGGLHFKRER